MAYLLSTHEEPQAGESTELDPPKKGYQPILVDSYKSGMVTVVWANPHVHDMRLEGLQELVDALKSTGRDDAGGTTDDGDDE